MSKQVQGGLRGIFHSKRTPSPRGRDAQTLSCAKAICRSYSGEDELPGGVSVVYQASPSICEGEIHLRISFRFMACSNHRRSSYAEKCVHNCINEYCHNYPVEELSRALSEALDASMGPQTRPPEIVYRKLVNLEWL